MFYMLGEKLLAKEFPKEGAAGGAAVPAEKLGVAGLRGRQPIFPVHGPEIASCKRITVTSCMLEGKIDGVPCPTVVHSGSKRMLVWPSVASHRQILATLHCLCGVTNDCTELKGPVDVKLCYGGYTWTCQTGMGVETNLR